MSAMLYQEVTRGIVWIAYDSIVENQYLSYCKSLCMQENIGLIKEGNGHDFGNNNTIKQKQKIKNSSDAYVEPAFDTVDKPGCVS